MKTLTSRYDSTCSKCGVSLGKGTLIDWSKDAGARCHGQCPSIANEQSPYQLGGGSGYGCVGWQEGQVLHVWLDGKAVYHQSREGTVEAWLYVVASSKKFYKEDGLSFGVGDDSGYYYLAACRLATEQEYSEPKAAREAELKAIEEKKVLNAQYRSLFRVEDGEYVQEKSVCLEGIRIPWEKGFNVFGGGVEFVVVGGDDVWHLTNNGADGDDWSRNNVRTGGAGAIGRKYPLTEQRRTFLRSLPGGQALEKSEPELKRELLAKLHSVCLSRHGVSEEIKAVFADQPTGYGSPEFAIWVVVEGLMIGVTPDDKHVYVDFNLNSVQDEDVCETARRTFKAYGAYNSLEFEATPERVAAIRRQFPDWVGTSQVGRFVVVSRFTADNAADALLAACSKHIAVNEIEVALGPTVKFISPELVRASKRGVILWSDQRLQVCSHFESYLRQKSRWGAWVEKHFDEGLPRPPEPCEQSESVSDAAVSLICYAMPRPYWRENRRVHGFLDVESISKEEMQAHENRRFHSGERFELSKIEALHKDGRRETLYLVSEEWWYLGEDGDAGEDYTLFDNLSEAQSEFQRSFKKSA